MSQRFRKQKFTLIFAVASIFLMSCGVDNAKLSDSASVSHITSVDILNFRSVVPGKIFRGGAPTPNQVKVLKDLGFKSIINLQAWPEVRHLERNAARALGFQYLESPIQFLVPVNDEKVTKVIETMRNPDNYPLYVHCLQGVDRTGMVIGLYRVIAEGWHPDRAFDEMLEMGFRRQHVFLEKYFFEKTEQNRTHAAFMAKVQE